MPVVHSYYEPVLGRPRPDRLLDLWKRSWESKGWETRILSESDAKDHPGYKLFSDRISRYPTVNPPAYERACYMRHLAMANYGVCNEADGSLMLLVDYDVINRRMTPNDFFSWGFQGKDFKDHRVCTPTILEPTRVPCAVTGDWVAFADICDILHNFEPNGAKHVSDMTIMRGTDLPTVALCVEHLCSGEPIQDHLGDGWKTAPMIHFSTFSFHKLGWKGDKADLIQRVLDTL